MIQECSNTLAHERVVRDLYAKRLPSFRKEQVLLRTEYRYPGTLPLRADMRTVDVHNILREWEFKKVADYNSLGQILAYVALGRRNENFRRQVQGVLAAFQFDQVVIETNSVLNLGIEIVRLPLWLAFGGGGPIAGAP